PEDVAVTGFNDVRTSRYLLPPLASVDRRDEEVADLAERLLFDRLADRAAPRRAHDVAMHFIWRDSAGGPPPTDAADLDTSRSSNRKGT
ncbi:MAG: substrate-binding domain-containing protein, partial [Phycisphaeraceae bacterium]